MSAFLESLSVIVSLVVIEGLLSVDNALAIAAMAAPPVAASFQLADCGRSHAIQACIDRHGPGAR